MKKGFFLLTMILALFCIPLASASITLSSPDPVYNLGDSISVKASASSASELNGYFKISLECDNSSNSFFVIPIKLKANEVKNINVDPITLTKTGKCSLAATIEDASNSLIERKQGDVFKISNLVNVSLTVVRSMLSPNEKLSVEGIAIRDDGRGMDGIATISFDNTYNVNVKNGKFLFENIIEEKAKSGEHIIGVAVRDGNGNIGEASTSVQIRQIPTSVSISVQSSALNPGETIKAQAQLLDQADDEISSEIILTLYDSWGSELSRKTMYNETFEYGTKTSSAPGNWWIYAYSQNLKSRKFIYINEFKNIDASIENNTLKITNTGNVVYNSPILITFEKDGNNESETKELSLGVGQSASFVLKGDGSYALGIRSNEFTKSFDVSLTGGAIGAKEITNPIRIIVAIVFVLVVLISAVTLRMKKGKQIKIKEVIKKDGESISV